MFHLKQLVFLLVILVGLEYDECGLVSAATRETRCIEREREALLRFKQGIQDDKHGYLSSWGSADDQKECCEWYGIVCSNTTGHVTDIVFYGFYVGGNISSDLLELRHLNNLNLEGNYFGGSIPDFLGSITSLKYLRLGFNQFTRSIPHQLGNLTNLRVLSLSFNSLSHKIPKSFGNLTRLQELYMNVNGLAEPLADFFGKLSCKSLESLDISYNQYTGPIPELSACSELKMLLLQDNQLSGSVPATLRHLSELEKIDVSYNSLQGSVSETPFSGLRNLYWLDLSSNSLTLNFSTDWIPPFSLNTITLMRCKMGPSFPGWLRTQTKVSYLDISDGGIVDQVPDWLWNLSTRVTHINISDNQISGTIPDLSSNFVDSIDITFNNFSGPVPSVHPNTTLVRFSQNMFSGSMSFICRVFSSQLVLLDLSDNHLEGNLTNCWDNARSLRFLNLNNNNFVGEIPRVLGSLRSLETLQLRGNNLSGKIPPALKDCKSLLLMDIGENKLTGTIPPWLGHELNNLTHLSLRRNMFYGGIPTEICSLTRIQMLDLSGNNLSGDIPLCFDKFSSLVDKNGPVSESISLYIDFKRSYYAYALVQWKGNNQEYRKTLLLLKLIDLSNNRLVGNIPREFSSLRGLISLNLSMNRLSGRLDPDIGEMEMLESLDLSNNQLSGEIPIGLARLYYLSFLDLANNSFTGKIPQGTQLQGFDASSYSGNDGLCGPPLSLCPNTSVIYQGESGKKKDDDGLLNIPWLQEFHVSLFLGFIVGFWGVVGSLVIKRSWRYAYFGLVDVVEDWFLAKFRQS